MFKPEAYTHVRSTTTSKEAWILKTWRLTLIRQLVKIRLENFENMRAYVKVTKVTCLNQLKTKYDPMVMAIEASGMPITSDFIKVNLLHDKYNKCKIKKESAFTVKKKSLKFNKNYQCFNC